MQALAAEAAASGKGLACAEAAPAHLPKSTMSHHYGVLRAAGLVRATKIGPAVIHTLRLGEVEARFPGVVSAILAAHAGAAPPADVETLLPTT